MNTTTTTNNNNNDNNNQNEGNTLSFSLSSLSLSLSLKNKRERKLLASFFTRELISFSLSLSLFLSGVSKLLFRVTNETLTTQCASFIEGKKITSKPHHENRRAFKAPRKEFFVAPLLRRRIRIRKRVFLGVLFNPFLSETRFSRRSRGERNHHHHSKVCVLLCFENSKRKHSSRRRRETPRCSAVVVVVHRRRRKRRESSEREREKVDEALFDFKRSSSIECLV